MKIELEMPEGLEEQIKAIVLLATNEAMAQSQKQLSAKEYFSIKEACEYMGVSFNTFAKFRLLGLRIIEIDGIKRVSKKVISEFLEEHSI